MLAISGSFGELGGVFHARLDLLRELLRKLGMSVDSRGHVLRQLVRRIANAGLQRQREEHDPEG